MYLVAFNILNKILEGLSTLEPIERFSWNSADEDNGVTWCDIDVSCGILESIGRYLQ